MTDPLVVVEFFGVARRRAGVPSTEVRAATLGDVLEALGNRFPDLAAACIEEGTLRPGYMASLNALHFTTDPATEFEEGDHVLILSSDAGG